MTLLGLGLGFAFAIYFELEFYEEIKEWQKWAVGNVILLIILGLVSWHIPTAAIAFVIGELIGRLMNWLVSDDYF